MCLKNIQVNRHMVFKYSTLFCMFLSLFVIGCSRKQIPPRKAAEWHLSPEAEITYYYLRFDSARRDGHPEEAAAVLEYLLDKAPSESLYLEGAEFYWNMKRTGSAREILQNGVAAYPASRSLIFFLANVVAYEGRDTEAIHTITNYIDQAPKDWEAYEILAYTYLIGEQYKKTLETVNRVPFKQQSPKMHYYSAKASLGLGNKKKAISQLTELVKESPDFVEAWAELAYQYEQQKNYPAAEQAYITLLNLTQGTVQVWLRLINLNIKLGNPKRALSFYAQGSGSLSFALETATLFLEQKLYAEAHEVLDPLPVESGLPDRVWFLRALLAFEGDSDLEQALYFLDQIPATSKQYLKVLDFKVQLYLELDKFDQALQVVKEQQKLQPENRENWLLEARICSYKKQYGKAYSVLEQAVAKWPTDTGILFSLGIVQDSMKRTAEAMETMEKVIRIEPKHADALNYIGYTLADENRELDRALSLITKALGLAPDSAHIIDSLAWVKYRLGEFKQAWTAINRAVKLMDNSAEIWEHYGDIALALGKKKSARVGYEKALTLVPEAGEQLRKKIEGLQK